jgi:hypothetical protein
MSQCCRTLPLRERCVSVHWHRVANDRVSEPIQEAP